MSNCELVQRLADGYKVAEIAKEFNISVTSLQKKIYILRERLLCKTVSHLVANYLRKKLID